MSGGLVVIGSGPAGLSAARAYREHRGGQGGGAVRIVTADVDLPYNRPPLSKDYLRGEIEEVELPLADPGFYPENGIDVLLRRTVRAVDPDAQTVALDDGTHLDYDVLVIASGASPTPLPVPGADGRHVLTLRSLADARSLRAAAKAHSAVVVGSGFIGCEAAVSLRRRGVAVTVVTQEERPQHKRLGDDVAQRLTGWLTEAGVALVTGAEITALIEQDDGRVEVQIPGHEPVTADIVLLAAGVAPNVDLVEGSGITTDEGRIVVDAGLRTNRAGVFAAGDVAVAHNATAGRPIPVEHWGDADTMGEIAGTNAAGGDAVWDAVPGFWSEIGDHTLKYQAWGDGFDDVRFVAHDSGGFTAWYASDGRVVGVLTSDADDDYERGERLIAEQRPISDLDLRTSTPATPTPTKETA